MDALQSKDRKFYIVLAITVIIMIGFGFLPPFGEVTPIGMRILGIFIGCVFAWCFGEIIWSSILGLIMISIFNFGLFNENYASAFGNATTSTMLCGMVFCFAVQSSGLLSEISRWIIGLRIVQKTPWTLIVGFFVASYILGILATNPVVAMVLLWPLYYDIARKLEIAPFSNYTTIILCGIGICAAAGVVTVPYGAMSVLVQGVARSVDPSYNYDTMLWIGANFLVNLIFIPLALFVLRFVIRPKFNFKMKQHETYKMNLTPEIKIVSIVFGILLVALIVPNMFPATSTVYQLFVTKIGPAGLLAAAAVVLAVIHVNGKPILKIDEGIKNGVTWGVLIMMSCAITISNYLAVDGVGILPTIVNLIEPFVQGKSSLVIAIMFVVIGLIMTNFINDAVTATVLYPIAAALIQDSGNGLVLFTTLSAAVTIQGCFMPSGSAIGAMFHSNTEWLKSKDIFIWVTILMAILCVCLVFVMWLGIMMGF